jgi:polysaccharide export outer membrane protein
VINKIISFAAIALLGSGCVSSPAWVASSGPDSKQINNVNSTNENTGIQIKDVDDKLARQLLSHEKQKTFSELYKAPEKSSYVIGAGDVLEVSIWEAPPATLFGSTGMDSSTKSISGASRNTSFPEQMVSSEGTISIPFAGQIDAAGKTPSQIEAQITKRLKDKANQPQVLVRITRNTTANVTVVGEVASSARVPLTARGERLLDVLASAGGVKQPVNKTTLQITRGDQVNSMPMEKIIRDPKQNIRLMPGDVVTAMYQPLSFTVLGATGKNEEQNFEAQGITLAQALARSGGLQDARADAQGVFIFRFEDPDAVDWINKPQLTPDGKVPVIYRVDLKNPATFFVAQSFPMKNKDVMYVSNAPAAELQKFLNILTSVVYTVATPVNLGLTK